VEPEPASVTPATAGIVATATAGEFWDDLIAFIEDGSVIPVVGPELLSIAGADGQRVPMYRAVSEHLLEKSGLTPAEITAAGLRPQRELYDAVAHLAKRGRRIQDLYRPTAQSIAAIAERMTTDDLAPLEALARIDRFNLFVTTTPDSLLVKVLDRVRYGGGPEKTQQIEFAPNLPGDRLQDLPERRLPSHTAVFHLFGKASPSPLYAIHDEDLLEFFYRLQAGGGHLPERLFYAIRDRNLLLIGCNLCDWLSRFFIRLASPSRLAGERFKREFLADQVLRSGQDLTVFLTRFSQNTKLCELTATDFITELSKQWTLKHPPPASYSGMATAPAPAIAGTIFVSYAKEDLEAALRLRDGLNELGGDVAWIDKSELMPGDEWDRAIHEAIRKCALFLPLVSRTTESRHEGFFREEWMSAAERARKIQGRAFIIPVSIDADYDPLHNAYAVIPAAFEKTQFAHAPDGVMSAALIDAIKTQLRAIRRPGH
jgi:hypothetical protein